MTGGRPAPTVPAANANLALLGRFWARWQPDAVAIACDDEEVTWADLERSSDALAHGLVAGGLAPGDVVAVLLGNRVEFLEVNQAALKAGAMVAPLNLRLAPAEVAHQVAQSGASWLVTETALLPAVEAAVEEVPGLRVVDVDDQGLDALRRPGGPFPIAPRDPTDGAYLAYTSGTTGLPKGAVLTHGGVQGTGAVRNAVYGLTSADRVLCVAQLGVAGTLLATWSLTCLVAGATMVLERTFDASDSVALIEERRVTTMFAVPIFFERMAGQAHFGTADLSAFRHAVTGGASVTHELLRQFHARDIPLVQGYGMTESCAAGTFLSDRESEVRLGSSGIPLIGHEVRITDDDGRDRPPGEPGEILLRGPGVLREYHRAPEATAAALHGGWLHSGDIGYLDDTGYLYVVDRKKDMVITGGFNVYPAEVERALAGLGGLDLCVIGVEDERWGETPVLVVHAEAGELDLDAVRSTLVRTLADFKRPRHVVVSDAPLPRSALGKLVKHELRQRYPVLPPSAIALW